MKTTLEKNVLTLYLGGEINSYNADNIEKEIALRFKPVNCLFLDQFMKEYGYYIGGAWGDYT